MTDSAKRKVMVLGAGDIAQGLGNGTKARTRAR